MTIVSIYAVFANADEAATIARTLIDERLAACANILAPCRSIYRWNGALEEAGETPAIFKTGRAQADACIARLAELHSYDIPCITLWPVDQALPDYAEWVEQSVG